jgi:hypothetical protein
MPYRTFNGWLFDGSRDSEFPKPRYADDGKEIIPDILKYNSPITATYVVSMFLKNGPLNHYLDNYLNNINLRYLDKKELFMFIKKCVLDFRLGRRDTVFIPWTRKTKLFGELRNKFPELKNCDISLLCDLVEESDQKEAIFNTLGLEKPKKLKVKKQKRKKKISLKEFMAQHFSIMDIK